MVSANEISTQISDLLSHDVHEYSDRIRFTNGIMLYKSSKFVEQHLDYKMEGNSYYWYSE